MPNETHLAPPRYAIPDFFSSLLSIPSRLDPLRLRARRRRSRRRCRRREHVFVTFLLRALLDLDQPLEVCSVFNDDLRRRQISIHRTVLLDLDLTCPTHITLHPPLHNHLPSNPVGFLLSP